MADGGANVNRWTKILSKYQQVLREGDGGRAKLHSLEPSKLTKLANVVSLAGLDNFGYFPV